MLLCALCMSVLREFRVWFFHPDKNTNTKTWDKQQQQEPPTQTQMTQPTNTRKVELTHHTALAFPFQ